MAYEIVCVADFDPEAGISYKQHSRLKKQLILDVDGTPLVKEESW